MIGRLPPDPEQGRRNINEQDYRELTARLEDADRRSLLAAWKRGAQSRAAIDIAHELRALREQQERTNALLERLCRAAERKA